jgi:hypothetical protein
MAVGDPSHWLRDTPYQQKLALISPTSGGRSVGIVRSRTKAAQEVLLFWSSVAQTYGMCPSRKPCFYVAASHACIVFFNSCSPIKLRPREVSLKHPDRRKLNWVKSGFVTTHPWCRNVSTGRGIFIQPHNLWWISSAYTMNRDRFYGTVVRVPGYISRDPGSIPGATRFSEK